MNLKGNWNVDRIPTENERSFAIVFSSIICLITGGVVLVGIILSIEGAIKLSSLSFFAILFILSSWVLVSSAFSKPSKPSAISIMVLGVFFVFFGVIFLVLLLFGIESSISIGAIGVLGGATVFLQGWRKQKSLNKAI